MAQTEDAMTLAQMKRSASELSDEDRADLADFLLESLDAYEAGVSAEWRAEAVRRMEEIDSGKEKGIPLEEVRRQLREKYP